MKRNFSIHQCLPLKAIKAFVNNELSEEERKICDEHFASCELCKEVKESFSTVNQPGVEEDISELRNTVFEVVHKKRIVQRRWVYSVAAGILLPILGITAFLFIGNNQDRIFDENFRPYIIMDRGSDRSPDGIVAYEQITLPKDLQLALDKYKEKNYKASLLHFEAYSKINSQNSSANLFYGIANLEVGDIDAAIVLLEKASIKGTKHYENATWYLALANIKKKNKEVAKKLLQELQESKFYGEKAQHILEQL